MSQAAHFSIVPSPQLLREDTSGVTTLTLNRPKQYNALSETLIAELQSALDSIGNDKAVRVLIIAGSGPAFCAGHDLKEMRANYERAKIEALFTQCSRLMLTLTQLPQPVIAKVQGIATAAGCQLVAQCDLAIAADTARFATSGINVGLFCSTPAVPLSRSIPRKQAMEMLLTGEFIDAATALRWGLLNRVVAADQLNQATARLAGVLKSKPRESLAIGKKLFHAQAGVGIAQAYAMATRAMTDNFMHKEAAEGVDAFLQKRPPNW
jgi:enoyl-CoA hydratase/carnithine racemase